MNSIRAFIAMPLPQPLKDAIACCQAKLKQQLFKGITWVQPEAMHITVKFLGDIETSQVAPIHKIMESTLAGQQKFEITVATLGTFPNSQSPRIIWVGMQDNTGQLIKIHERLEMALETIQIPAENKEFRLHITVGRVKHRPDPTFAKILQPYQDTAFGSWPLSTVTLFQSTLCPDGPIYKPLAEVKLSL